jgi:immune inhibitor A
LSDWRSVRGGKGLRRQALALVALVILAGCSGAKAPARPAETFIGTPVTQAAVGTENALGSAAHVPQDRYADAVSVKHIPPAKLKPASVENPKVGDKHEFYVNYDLETDFRRYPATLRYTTDNGAWWVADNTTLSDQDIKVAADGFESNALKIDRLIYGHEPSPGIDGYNKVNFLFIDMPNWKEFYGYFSTLNEYPRAIERYSNEEELLVINTNGQSLTTPDFAGELAHEFGHLIMYSHDPNEDLWMNEGSSELAKFFTTSPPEGALMNEGNEQVFANYPFIQLTARPDTTAPGFDRNTIFAHYGAEKLFMIYLLDRFGPRFIRDLIADPLPGVLSLNNELGKLDPPLTFNDVFADWTLANLMDQPDHPQGHFGYSAINTLQPSIIALDKFTGENLPGYMPPYSTFYYELHAQDKLSVDFQGATMARLTPVDPYQGKYAWYSDRGDETTFSLERAFDLTGVHSATLNYRVWYDLEKGYDYGYVLASTDGGKTWDDLPTKYGMAEHLSGDAYGIGYTGDSKTWLQESLDLSPYAGQNVLIKFVVNTDLATNLPGMMIDNIEIPQIHYFDGAEDDKGGWTAQGFVRSSNTVPVDWVVWIVKVNIDPNKVDEVTRVKLDDLQSAKIDIDGFGKTFDFAAMVISPMASTTTQSVDYEFSLTGK